MPRPIRRQDGAFAARASGRNPWPMEQLSLFLPEGLPLWAALAAITAAFFTAALTAAFGLGGGLALLAVMSAIFPAAAVIPIHGVAQLGSNAGRFYLQRKDVLWSIALWFSAGSLLGAVVGGKLALALPVWLLQFGVAIFVLITVWGPKPPAFSPGVRTFFSTGAVSGFLSMFFGATGPIAAAMLKAINLERLNLVATHAACMVFQHGLKILVFGALGFAFSEWAVLTAAIVLVGFAGTAAGTHYLRRMPEEVFKKGFNLILTAIAGYLLISAGVNFRTD